MPSKAELHSTFSNFPSEDYIDNTCKRGQHAEACRYLVFDEGFSCGKASFSRGMIDKRFKEGDMGAKGDNCDGILGFVNENQSLLVGNKTIYKEQAPTITEEATFERLEIENGRILLTTSKENFLNLSEEDVQIDINPKGLAFSARGLGAFVGTLQILFEEPQR